MGIVSPGKVLSHDKTLESCSAIAKNEILHFLREGLGPETVTLRGKSQAQRNNMLHVFTYTCNSDSKRRCESIRPLFEEIKRTSIKEG